ATTRPPRESHDPSLPAAAAPRTLVIVPLDRARAGLSARPGGGADDRRRGPGGPALRGRAAGAPARRHRVRRPGAALGHPVHAVPQPLGPDAGGRRPLLADRLRPRP